MKINHFLSGNKKHILIILLVIGMIIMMNQGKKMGHQWGSSTVDIVNKLGRYTDFPCLAPISPWDISKDNCVINICGTDAFYWNNGYYFFQADYISDCSGFTLGELCAYKCLYGESTVWDCIDSDAHDYSIKGIAYNAEGFIAEDVCDGNILYEFYCGLINGKEFVRVESYSCPEICSNGQCISGSAYSDFLSNKISYLSGGSFLSFISNANNWVNS